MSYTHEIHPMGKAFKRPFTLRKLFSYLDYICTTHNFAHFQTKVTHPRHIRSLRAYENYHCSRIRTCLNQLRNNVRTDFRDIQTKTYQMIAILNTTQYHIVDEQIEPTLRIIFNNINSRYPLDYLIEPAEGSSEATTSHPPPVGQ